LVERYHRRGLSDQGFAALSFCHSPSADALRDYLLSKDDGDVTAQAFKYHPELNMWAVFYVGSNALFANDFATVWTKLCELKKCIGKSSL
jgi:hypothetical protein